MRNTWRIVCSFVASRWRGHVLLERVFWRDMLFVGTAINVGAALLAIALMAIGAPTALAIATFLAPLPYNFLLYVGVWMAAAQAQPARAAAVRLVATLWMIASVVI